MFLSDSLLETQPSLDKSKEGQLNKNMKVIVFLMEDALCFNVDFRGLLESCVLRMQLAGKHWILWSATFSWLASSLCFIIFLHSRLLFVKIFTLCGVLLRIVIMFLCRLFHCPICACYCHFLRVGAPVFLVFLVCFSVFYVHCIRGLRACC